MKLGKAVVKGRVLILVVALLLLIPSVFGMIFRHSAPFDQLV